MRSIILGLLYALVLIANSASAQLFHDETLEPRSYRSASGEFELAVDPSTRIGAGAGTYRLVRKGVEQWKVTHPFTLREVAVAADGSSIGFGYSNGLDGYRSGVPDRLCIAILAPDGELRRLHERDRKQLVPDSLPNPLATGIILEDGRDRGIVRVRDADSDSKGELWCAFRLSTGEELESARPKEHQNDAERLRSIVAAMPVSDTPLILVQWSIYSEPERGQAKFGARFTLVDDTGRAWWKLDRPDEFTGADEEQTRALELDDSRRPHGSIVRWDEAHRFELLLPKAGQCITFEVTGDAVRGWSAREVSRRSDEQVPVKDADTASEENTPVRDLEFLGAVDLAVAKTPMPEVRSVVAFAFDGAGNIAFLRQERDPSRHALVFVDAHGALIAKHDLPIQDESQASYANDIAWLADDTFLVGVNAPTGHYREHARIFAVDARTGVARLVTDDVGANLQNIARLGEGRFVVLADYRLDAFDRDGKRLWRLESSDGLCGANSLTVLQNGSIVLCDTQPGGVQWVSAKGKLGRYLPCEKSWSRKPRYVSRVHPDVGGGMIVADSGQFVRMNSEGALVGDWNPRYADGRRVRVACELCAGPDGRLWASDLDSILGFDAKGQVEIVLGEGPDTQRLVSAAAICLDHDDHILVAAARTGNVYTFDVTGALLRLMRPAPTDFSEPLSSWDARLSVDDDHNVWLWSAQPVYCVRWTPDGTRSVVTGDVTPTFSEAWLAQSGTKNRWVLDDDHVSLLSPHNTPLTKIDRKPDGHWLRYTQHACAAFDGSLAVLSARDSEPNAPLDVVIVGADGKARTQLPLKTKNVFPVSMAYDGARVAVLSGDHLEVHALEDGAVRSIVLPGIDVRTSSTSVLLLPRKCEEAWVFDGEHTLRRYMLARR